MGKGAVLFNHHTWQTHILTPAAAIMLEALLEHFGHEPVATRQALDFFSSELGVDTDLRETAEFLVMLKRLGVVV